MGQIYQVYIIDSCRSVDHINYSLITPVNRQMQSDGYDAENRANLRHVNQEQFGYTEAIW